MLRRVLLLVLCALPAALAAQTLTQPKFGYLNYAEVLKAIPQYAEAEANLAKLQGQYDAEIQRSEDEFTRKYAEFLQEQKDFPQNIMVKRHKELQELMEKSIAFKHEIQTTLETARDKMLEPLTAELNDAISRVALKYNLDYECRQQGIYAPADLDQCIKTLARDRGLLYAAELHLLRENTGETIVVYFTSNASDNVVWRVLYNNDVNEIEGDHEKFADQREKKILAFWQAVLDKYGAPNSGTDKWISTTNAYDPVMTAYYGSLDLVDNGLYASDMAKNVQQARENFQSKPYAF